MCVGIYMAQQPRGLWLPQQHHSITVTPFKVWHLLGHCLASALVKDILFKTQLATLLSKE